MKRMRKHQTQIVSSPVFGSLIPSSACSNVVDHKRVDTVLTRVVTCTVRRETSAGQTGKQRAVNQAERDAGPLKRGAFLTPTDIWTPHAPPFRARGVWRTLQSRFTGLFKGSPATRHWSAWQNPAPFPFDDEATGDWRS